LLAATYCTADIKYPQDLKLLNEVRKQLEKLIEKLYKSLKVRLEKKPRTYQKEARKAYLAVAKKKKVTVKQMKKAIKKQLQYIKRNLLIIYQLLDKGGSLSLLKKQEYKNFLVSHTIYEQQLWMYENNKRSIKERIVSLTQPHVRPIVRGKAGKSVEFGAKIAVSCCDKYVFLENFSWENFNESTWLKIQVENYRELTGYYPESVHVDRIYRTRENRKWCKERGIRREWS